MARFIYIYILQGEAEPDRFYIGRTFDLRVRLTRHNAGFVRHTSKWKPWRLKTYITLSDVRRATALERYLSQPPAERLLKSDFNLRIPISWTGALRAGWLRDKALKRRRARYLVLKGCTIGSLAGA